MTAYGRCIVDDPRKQAYGYMAHLKRCGNRPSLVISGDCYTVAAPGTMTITFRPMTSWEKPLA